MLVLGIVLIVLAVLFGLGVAVSSAASTTLEVFGVDLGASVPTVFFLGVLTGAALLFGLWLTKAGAGRGYRRHKEIRELRAQAAPRETAAADVTAADAGADVPPGTSGTAELPADDRLAVEQDTAPDPSDTKQPH